MSTAPTLDVVVVNWNAGHLLTNCLNSIADAEMTGYRLMRVVVVDNGSTDGSLESLSKIGSQFDTIRNTSNLGFAAACNQGAKNSEADYLLFLNPDTRLSKNSISGPIDLMQRAEHQSIGICGVQLVDDNGNVSRSCARFPTPRIFLITVLGLDRVFPAVFRGPRMTEWSHAENKHVDQIIGAFFLVRGCLFRLLGGFDERFFVYFEEVDFSLRASKAGWKSFYLADARAYHKGGGSSGKVRAERLFYSLRSRIQYAEKHFSRMGFLGVLAATVSIEFATRLIHGIIILSMSTIVETVRAYLMLWRDVPTLIRAHDAWRRQ